MTRKQRTEIDKDAYESQLDGAIAPPEKSQKLPLGTSATFTALHAPMQFHRRHRIGDIVHFVMPDAITIRPAIITALVPPTALPDPGKVNMQVFVDGQYDRTIRGPHADATLTDWKLGVPHVEANADGEYPATSWHWPTDD